MDLEGAGGFPSCFIFKQVTAIRIYNVFCQQVLLNRIWAVILQRELLFNRL